MEATVKLKTCASQSEYTKLTRYRVRKTTHEEDRPRCAPQGLGMPLQGRTASSRQVTQLLAVEMVSLAIVLVVVPTMLNETMV